MRVGAVGNDESVNIVDGNVIVAHWRPGPQGGVTTGGKWGLA